MMIMITIIVINNYLLSKYYILSDLYIFSVTFRTTYANRLKEFRLNFLTKATLHSHLS